MILNYGYFLKFSIWRIQLANATKCFNESRASLGAYLYY